MVKWYDAPIAVMDFESTGFKRPMHIVEIGVIRYEDGSEVVRMSELVSSPKPIEPGASAVHGIKDEDIADCPTFEEHYPALTEILTGAIPASYGPYDRRILHEELGRLPGPVDRSVPAYSLEWGPYLDILGWARQLHPGTRGKGAHTLGAMVERYGVTLEKSHRAADDALAAADLLWLWRNRLPDVSLSKLLRWRLPR